MYRADDLASIQVPTLIATGEWDLGSTPDMTVQLAQRIPGAQSVVLAEQRHMMPVESPRLVNQMLLDFLGHARTLSDSAKGIVA
ncbi:putative aminoacrylate hydrolase RutD [compost metagenome]